MANGKAKKPMIKPVVPTGKATAPGQMAKATGQPAKSFAPGQFKPKKKS